MTLDTRRIYIGGLNMRGELKIGRKAPDFELQATTGHKIRLSDYEEKKNVILVSFPLAFTPVWTLEISAFGELISRFAELNAQVLGISVDSVYAQKAWIATQGNPDYPLISDFYPHGAVARKYGLFLEDTGTWKRTILVIDKNRIIRWSKIYESGENPNPMDALVALRNLP